MIEGLRRSVVRLESLPAVVRYGLVVAQASTIWWLSSLSDITTSTALVVGFVFNGGHFVLFGILGALLAIALRPRTRLGTSAAFAVALAWGILDELHQRHVPGRVASVSDVATDACGAGFTVALLWWLRTRARRGLWILGALVIAGFAAITVATFD